MGLEDRDYMKSDSDEVINLNEIIIAGFKLVAIIVLLFVFLRVPPIWIKLPLMLATLFFGWRWISSPRRQKAHRTPPPTTQQRRSLPATPLPSETEGEAITPIQQLIALDAAGEFGKAKTYIQQLDGEEFPEEVAKELEILAKNYFPVRLDKTENGARFYLD